MICTCRIATVKTEPFVGQKPGTSGLRKPVTTFSQANYLENFVQCVLEAGLDANRSQNNHALVVGGDGRYHSPAALKTILQQCAANKV